MLQREDQWKALGIWDATSILPTLLQRKLGSACEFGNLCRNFSVDWFTSELCCSLKLGRYSVVSSITGMERPSQKTFFPSVGVVQKCPNLKSGGRSQIIGDRRRGRLGFVRWLLLRIGKARSGGRGYSLPPSRTISLLKWTHMEASITKFMFIVRLFPFHVHWFFSGSQGSTSSCLLYWAGLQCLDIYWRYHAVCLIIH